MKEAILALIRFYQKLNISSNVCRFTPTCSQYTYQAIEKYGVSRGLFIGLKRIVRCHPWSKGGVDRLK